MGKHHTLRAWMSKRVTKHQLLRGNCAPTTVKHVGAYAPFRKRFAVSTDVMLIAG